MATKRKTTQVQPHREVTMPRIMDAAQAEGVIVKQAVFYGRATTITAIGTVHQIIPFASAVGGQATRYELTDGYKHKSGQPVFIVNVHIALTEAE